MDKTVPLAAARMLDFVRETEVGTDGPSGYNVIYGFNQDKLPKPVTQMTIDEVLGAQASWSKRFGSSATGGYQFMRATLTDLKRELGLRGTQVLDSDLQDRLGFHLLKRRGYEDFMAGRISRTDFGKRLAMEWASFPVLAATRGAHHQLDRGQSYYRGDALNKALVKPEEVEAIIDEMKELGDAMPAPAPVPTPRPEVCDAPLAASPVVTPIAQGLSPIEQMNKPVKGAQANAGAASVGALILTLWASSGYFPEAWKEPAMMAALGALFTSVPGIIAGAIAAYRARDKRFQQEPSA